MTSPVEERFDRLTEAATMVSLTHTGLEVIPSIVAIVQKEYGKQVSGTNKKSIAAALIKSVLPDDMDKYHDVIGTMIDMVFAVVKDKELRKLLKKSCCCK